MVRAGDLTVIGDWDGDGVDNIGVYRPGSRRFYLDDDDNGIHDHGVTLGIEGDTPVTGDWNGDGKTDVGFFKPCENTFYPDTDYNGIIDKIVVFSDSGGMDDDKIAVVAGIADYKDNTINPDAGRPYIPDLNYADNDAESIRDLLQRNGWQTVMLTDSSATKAAVESAIKSGTANASRFLFFSPAMEQLPDIQVISALTILFHIFTATIFRNMNWKTGWQQGKTPQKQVLLL